MQTIEAKCFGLINLFFDERPQQIEQAKAICADCSRITMCLTDALERGEAYGVWGGTDYEDRKIIAAARGYVVPSRRQYVEHGTTRGYAWHQRESVPIAIDRNGIDTCGCRSAYRASARDRVQRYRKKKRAEREK